MDLKNYYERHKELAELQQQVLRMRKQQKINNLHRQLRSLHDMKKELFKDMESVNENCDYINRTIRNVEPILHSDDKITMSQESAINFKRIVEMVLALSNYEDCGKSLDEDSLNFDTGKLIATLENSVDIHRTNLHYTTTLISNIRKIMNPNFVSGSEKRTIEKDEQISPTEFNNSGHTITFSEAFASSPLQ